VLRLTLGRGQDAVAVTKALAQAGVGILQLTSEHATLEDLFFRLTAADDRPDREAA
jgi:hypothetical protein